MVGGRLLRNHFNTMLPKRFENEAELNELLGDS